MENKIIDFKQPINSGINITKKQDQLNSKKFSSALETVNNNMNAKETSKKSVEFESSNNLKTGIINEDSKNTEKTVSESVEEKDNEKDYINAYEGVMLLLKNVPEIKNDTEIKEENHLELDIDMVNILSRNDQWDNLETTDELIMNEDTINNIIGEEIEIPIQNDKEIESAFNKVFNFDTTDDKANINNIDNKVEPKTLLNVIDTEKGEEVSIVNEENATYIDQSITHREFSNSDQNQKSNSENHGDEQETMLIKTKSSEDELDIKDKPFVLLEKDGIRFVEDSGTELENTDVIDRKDLIQQIVDKMKIDLSESKNEIKISLKPGILGEMTMNIEVSKGEIIAKIMVDNYRTKEIIENNLILLKEEIKDTGLEIKTFEVFVGNGSDFDKHNSNQFNLNQNNKKIKIKGQNIKSMINYEEGSIDNKINSIGLYSENGLNLFA